MFNEPMIARTDLDSLSDYSVQLNRWFLKPIGAWPASSTTSKLEKMVSLSLIMLCYFFILATIVPCALHLLFEEEDIRTMLKVMGPLSHWLLGGINYTTLLLRKKEIKCCVDHVKTDWRSVTRPIDQQIMLKDAKIGRYVATICAIFMHSGVLTYCTIIGTTTQIIQIGNETRTIRSIPCAFYKKLLPVDTSPTNEIVLGIQFASAFVVNSSNVSAFSLAAVFAAHAQGQLKVLMMLITELVNQTRAQARNYPLKEIGVIVENHLRVLTFISRIEDVMTEICFTELFKSTFAICMLGYYTLTEWDDREYRSLTSYFILLSSYTFNIFIVCYIGEKLSEQCKKIGEVVYMTNWYYLPDKDILNLMLIISRSSTVVNITAGKIVQMSIQTFSDVIKTAFAYLNVLRQTT